MHRTITSRAFIRPFHHSVLLYKPRQSSQKLVPSKKRSQTLNSIIKETSKYLKKIESPILPHLHHEDNKLIRRINETAGNLKVEELIYLKIKETDDDILIFEKITEPSLKNLIDKFGEDSSNKDFQVFMMTELFKLALQNKALFKNIASLIVRGNKIFDQSAVDRIVTLRINEKESILNKHYILLLVDMSLSLKNTILAASLLLRTQNPDYRIISIVLNSLMMKNPVLEEIQVDLIYRISQQFKYRFNEYECSQVIEKLQNINDISLYTKFLNYLLMNTKFLTKNSKIAHIYKLIQSNAELNNPSGVYVNWKKIVQEKSDISKHDVRIIALLLKTFNKSRKYLNLSTDIISSLPESYYSKPLLIPYLLNYCSKAQNVDFANAVINSLKPPIPRNVLSDLLRLNFTFKDMNGVERIVNQIMAESKLNHKDNEVIVKGLLKNGKFTQALVFIENIKDTFDAVPSYLVTVDYIINNFWQNLKEEHLVIIDKYVEDVRKVHSPSFWAMLSSIYIKWLNKLAYRGIAPQNLQLAKIVYENSTRNSHVPQSAERRMTKDITFAHIDNPFRFSQRKELESLILSIPTRSRVVIVKNIADTSIKLRSTPILRWCCIELQNLGLTQLEIKIDITRKLNKSSTSVGFMNDLTSKDFEKSWEVNAMNLIKNEKFFIQDGDDTIYQ